MPSTNHHPDAAYEHAVKLMLTERVSLL
eukprot:IDg8384t1